MAVDLETYAFSFSHAIIRLADQQFSAINAISFSQDIERTAVFGTSRSPLRRSAGQLALGEGAITFSDVDEGLSFYATLGDDPSLASFAIDLTLANEQGGTRSYELQGCALSGISVDFESGGDALQQDYPFIFMRVLVDGAAFAK